MLSKNLRNTFLLSLLTMRLTFAHLGTLTGTVIDAQTRLPLRNVTVQLVGTGKMALTDEVGRYRFEHLAPALYK